MWLCKQERECLCKHSSLFLLPHCTIAQTHSQLVSTFSLTFFCYINMVVTIKILTIPCAITAKNQPQNRGQPDQPPPATSTIGISETSHGNGNLDLNLLRLLIEHMEHGNIRIRKL